MKYRMVSMSMGSLALVAATMAGPVADAGAADRGGAYVVTRSHAAPPAERTVRYEAVDPLRRTAARVVHRPVVEPAAVVSRSLSEQPVLPHLVEVELGGTTMLIDPQVQYPRLDENHTIRWAQRVYKHAQPARPARVIRNPHAGGASSAERSPHPLMPRAIFLHPDYMDQMDKTPPAERDRPGLPEVQDRDGSPESPSVPMPHVPAPPRAKADLLVQGD
ncbi:MAG: hypothetical protein WD534_14335 [Phycisphaeraceae bacterium]